MRLAAASQKEAEALGVLVARGSALSRCEAQAAVFDYLGWRRAEIAQALHVSPATVKTYWRRAYRKTGCPGRASLREWVAAQIDINTRL